MKIGLITTMFEQEYNSITYNELAKRYVERGHEVHVIGKREKDQLPYEKVDGIMMHRVKVPNFPTSRSLLPFFAKRVLQELDDQVDIFDLHAWHGFGLGRVIKKPYVVQMPSAFMEVSEKLKSILWRDLTFKDILSGYIFIPYIMAKVETNVCSGAERIIAMSKHTEEMLIKYYQVDKDKITIIPAGIDINRFNPDNGGEMWREKLNIDDKRVVLCMAKLSYFKGVHYLIEAFKKISNQYKDTILVIAGSGDKAEEKRLYNLVASFDLKGKVIFTGWVNHSEVPYLHAAADVFVHPSLWEGTPLVILEAMATGKPVIATDIAGIPDMITDGTDGFVVEEKNVEQIAEKLSVLLEEEMLCKKFGDKARKKAEEKFDWDIIGKRILDVYGSILDEVRPL